MFNAKNVEVQYDSKKAAGEYTVTIKAGEKTKTWGVCRLSIPKLKEKTIKYTKYNSGERK